MMRRSRSIGMPRTAPQQSDNNNQYQAPVYERRNPKGETAFHQAVIRSQHDRATRLLNDGANVNTFDNFGWTPLHEASNAGDVDMIGIILDHPECNVNTCGGFEVERMGLTPLHDAAGTGNMAACKVLIAAGADPTLQDADGMTPFATATSEGFDDIAKLLMTTPTTYSGASTQSSQHHALSQRHINEAESVPPSHHGSHDGTEPMDSEPDNTSHVSEQDPSDRHHDDPMASGTHVSDAKVQALQDVLSSLFARQRSDTLTLTDVERELERRRQANDLTRRELDNALSILGDKNLVMLADGQVVRI
eukprot:m.203295 g.203295  ORF g.203295 m.203295 type:complete len:306 (-) comp22072_c0_seq1:169-1086(-)